MTKQIPTPSKVKKQKAAPAAQPDNGPDQAERTRLAKEEMKAWQESQVDFPFDAFPERMRKLLSVFAETTGFPKEYFFAANLVASSALIGNKFRIRAKADFTQACVLYLAMVGKSGIGKSKPIEICFHPLQAIIEKNYRLDYERKKAKRKEEEKALKKGETLDDDRPEQVELVLDEATVEDIYNTLTASPTGCVVVKDELTGWIKSFNQYRPGGDQEFWLTAWNNSTLLKIGRVGRERLYIYRPFIPVFGGVQPEIVHQLADGDKSVNGFLARFLFVIPENVEVPQWSEVEPDQTVYDAYNGIMLFLHGLPGKIRRNPEIRRIWDIESIDLPLGDKAKPIYVDYYNRLAGRMNAEEDDRKFSQLSKFRGYCLRFALIIELLDFACKNFEDPDWKEEPQELMLEALEKMKISEQSIKAAILLTEYFINTSMNVLGRFENPINTYKLEVRQWYKSLGESFRSAEAVEIAEKDFNIKRSTAYNYLNDKRLFKKLDTGAIAKTITV